ncbi:MAG: dephospho-CoA kinase [Parachlamydiales bacterium]|nr:dephospho-CoA kinase [Parachlamydiales bacterium]
MLTLQKIAITGEPGSGKSTVCDIFQQYHAYVVHADNIVHHLLKNETIIQKIIELLGSGIVTNNQIDHQKVADLVFTHPEALQKLENLLHPLVKREIAVQMHQALLQRYSLFVAEIPLLFEQKWDEDFNIVMTICADDDIKKMRLRQKGADTKDYNRRVQRMMDEQEKVSRSDYVIYNNGSLLELKNSLRKIIEELS